MSVTTDLAQRESSLRRFLDEWLPHRRNHVGHWFTKLRRGLKSRPPEMPLREYVGSALELRIGLDLARRPGYQRELAYLPPSRCARLMNAAGFQVGVAPFEVEETVDPLLRNWKRASRPGLPVDEEQIEALFACYDAAHVSGVFGRRERGWSVEECRTWIHNPWVFDYLDQSHEDVRSSLSMLWERYVTSGRAQLLSCGDRVVLQPEVATNFGFADMVIGRTLVDVKVYADPRPNLWPWLDQLLAYALLDEFGHLQIERLAVYLGWDALLLDVDLDELVTKAGREPDLQIDHLRNAIREDLSDQLWQARERHNFWCMESWKR